MNNLKLNIVLIIAGGIITHSSIHAFLQDVTETVQKATAGAAETVERVTGAVIPPAEKIVAVPVEVAKKTTSAVADVFRNSDVQIINNADCPLRVELMHPNKEIYKIIIINPGDQEIIEKPFAVRFVYEDKQTEVCLVKKGTKRKPVIIHVSLDKGKIKVKHGKKSRR